MAARLAKRLPDGESEKYSVVTMTDCRKLLQPPLSSRHVGKLLPLTLFLTSHLVKKIQKV